MAGGGSGLASRVGKPALSHNAATPAPPANSMLAQMISPPALPQGIAMPTDGSPSPNPVARAQGAAALHTSPAQVSVPTAIQGHPPQALLRSRRNR